MVIHDWRTTAEQLIRAVAPEFADAPIYILSYEEVSTFDQHLAYGSCLGWTSRILDLQCKPYLEQLGRWVGRGFCTIIHESRVPDGPDRNGIALHEFGHYLTVKEHLVEELFSEAEISRAMRNRPRDDNELPTGHIKRPAGQPRWFQHEQDFVRASAHLGYRGGQELASIRPRHLRFASPYFGQHFRELEFMTSLSSELGDARPIREILASPAPQSFVDLWTMATDWYTQEKETANVTNPHE